MKTIHRHLVSALGLAVAFPAVHAADATAPAPKEQKKEVRVLVGPGATVHRVVGKQGEKETVTYLGVETAPVPAALTAQLGLAEGQGLVVNHVSPGSPAAGALKTHDILLKLDDQILVEQRQLAVLIRGHKDGDEVTLTFLRGGKSATATVKLARHEVPKLSLTPGQPGANIALRGLATLHGPDGAQTFELPLGGLSGQNSAEHVNRILSMIDGAPGVRRMDIVRGAGAPGDRAVSVTVNTGHSVVVLDDDKGSLSLSLKDGQKQLVAKNAKGGEIFSGPVDTPEQRKALPEEVRARLEKLEDSHQFSFRTDADFQGAETKTIVPRPHSISLPRGVPEPRRLPEFL
ncbi:MAG: hypothetical protein RLZZ15_2384 [Verrucomicrobiota bacterium]|jgi:hypothetical protein